MSNDFEKSGYCCIVESQFDADAVDGDGEGADPGTHGSP